MKRSALVLAGSLIVNATLLGLLVAGSTRGKNSIQPPASGSALIDKPGHGAAPSGIDPKIWSNLQPSRLEGLFQRLRTAGFSTAVARALLAAQVRADFASRRAALTAGDAERPFWEPATPDPKTAVALAEIRKEENEAIKALLGTEAWLDEPAMAVLRQQYPLLSDAKIAAIQRSRQEVAEKIQELGINPNTDSAAPPELVAFMKEREAEIARLLTPQEREDYDLRAGSTAHALRQNLAGFDPSEQEFRALYQLQRAHEEATKRPADAITLSSPANDAERQLIEQMKATLGEQRYADYLRSVNGGYQQTARLADRLELPMDSANQAYAIQKEFQQRLAALEADRQLPPAERNARLNALAGEAQARVTAVLGPRGYEAYRQYGGTWITLLQPRPTPVPTTR